MEMTTAAAADNHVTDEVAQLVLGDDAVGLYTHRQPTCLRCITPQQLTTAGENNTLTTADLAAHPITCHQCHTPLTPPARNTDWVEAILEGDGSDPESGTIPDGEGSCWEEAAAQGIELVSLDEAERFDRNALSYWDE